MSRGNLLISGVDCWLRARLVITITALRVRFRLLLSLFHKTSCGCAAHEDPVFSKPAFFDKISVSRAWLYNLAFKISHQDDHFYEFRDTYAHKIIRWPIIIHFIKR